MDGTTPSADLLGRIRRGEIGGVILFGATSRRRRPCVTLTAKLHAAATAGGQPPLLIAVDQEGGPVKRIPWAPPTLSPPQMGGSPRSRSPARRARTTGAALHDLGIDVDFAPVADVPASTASFMYRDGRTCSFNATRTAVLSDAFATGLESKGVAPGDEALPRDRLRDPEHGLVRRDDHARRRPRWRRACCPTATAIAHHIPMIMLSNATYSAYDAPTRAGWSPAIAVTLLRHDLGFTGVTITDSLDGTAHARGLSTRVARHQRGAGRAPT